MTPTLLIAAYGSLLATGTLIWTIYRDGFRDRARVEVYPAIMELVQPKTEHDVLTVRFTNTGGKSVMITHVCLAGPGTKHFLLVDDSLPKRLAPGEYHICLGRQYESLGNGFSKVYVVDSLGRKFYAPRKETLRVEAEIKALAGKGVTHSSVG